MRQAGHAWACAALLLTGGCASAPEPVQPFDAWYSNGAEGEQRRALWSLLTPIGESAPEGDRVHLLRRDGEQLEANLYQGDRCMQRWFITGEWRQNAFSYNYSVSSGLPPLAWGTQWFEASLRVLPVALRADVHESSFGMFLFIAGGAPDRDVSYRFIALTGMQSSATACPAPDDR